MGGALRDVDYKDRLLLDVAIDIWEAGGCREGMEII